MQLTKKPLSKAISFALAGSALFIGGISSASASSTTMYNTFISSAPSATDGWVYGFNTGGTNATRAIAYDPANPQAYTAGGVSRGGFYGTDSSNPTAYSSILPFGYGGTSHLNWGLHLTLAGDTAEISSADAQNRYGYAAEIDTGGGAWRDNGTATGGIPTGWKHQTDVGLIKSDVTQKITLNLTNLNAAFSARFGITVFEGMDSQTNAYVHHGGWNNYGTYSPGGAIVHPYDMNNPFGTVGLTNKGYSDWVDSTAAHAFTFTAEAGKVYSIYLGGVDFGDWNDNVAGYKLNIATSPVPVPGAVWLFGSALFGMIGYGRRKAA